MSSWAKGAVMGSVFPSSLLPVLCHYIMMCSSWPEFIHNDTSWKYSSGLEESIGSGKARVVAFALPLNGFCTGRLLKSRMSLGHLNPGNRGWGGSLNAAMKFCLLHLVHSECVDCGQTSGVGDITNWNGVWILNLSLANSVFQFSH